MAEQKDQDLHPTPLSTAAASRPPLLRKSIHMLRKCPWQLARVPFASRAKWKQKKRSRSAPPVKRGGGRWCTRRRRNAQAKGDPEALSQPPHRVVPHPL